MYHACKEVCMCSWGFHTAAISKGERAWEAQRSSIPSPLMAGEEEEGEEEGIMGGGSKGGATNRLAAAPAGSMGGGHSVPRRVDPSLACSGCLGRMRQCCASLSLGFPPFLPPSPGALPCSLHSPSIFMREAKASGWKARRHTDEAMKWESVDARVLNFDVSRAAFLHSTLEQTFGEKLEW